MSKDKKAKPIDLRFKLNQSDLFRLNSLSIAKHF